LGCFSGKHFTLRIQKPTVKKQWRDFRLTDVFGDVIKPLLVQVLGCFSGKHFLLRIQKPTVKKQWRDFRLTDVFGDVIKPLLVQETT
jgi:hypothetical protein